MRNLAGKYLIPLLRDTRETPHLAFLASSDLPRKPGFTQKTNLKKS